MVAEAFHDTVAWESFMSGLPVGPRRRELVGDNLKGKPVPKTCLVPERSFHPPLSSSLLQVLVSR